MKASSGTERTALGPAVSTLYSTLKGQAAEICVAYDGNRMQPVYALINCKLLSNLKEYLFSGNRKIDHWYAQHKLVLADFSDKKDCFMNVNAPEDQTILSKLLLN